MIRQSLVDVLSLSKSPRRKGSLEHSPCDSSPASPEKTALDLSRFLLGGNKHRSSNSSSSPSCLPPSKPSKWSAARTLGTASVTEGEISASDKKKTRSKQAKRAPRVRFEIDPERDDVRSTVCEYEIDLDSEEFGNCYSPRCQLKQHKTLVIQNAHEFAQENREYVRALEGMFHSPLSPSLKASNKGKSRSSDENASSTSSTIDEDVGALFDLHGDCYSESRGLEPFMVPVMKRHKRWAISTTVRRHKQLTQESQRLQKKKGPKCADGNDDAAEILRLCCEVINASTRDLALAMAEADSREAQRIYSEQA